MRVRALQCRVAGEPRAAAAAVSVKILRWESCVPEHKGSSTIRAPCAPLVTWWPLRATVDMCYLEWIVVSPRPLT